MSIIIINKKLIFKYTVLFTVGGTLYYLIELLWRGHSYISMAITGGICFVLIGLINEVLSWETPLVFQMFIAACIITVVEFIAGCILNLWLKLDIWDYSNMPLNLLGQICIPYFFLWYLLSAVGIILDDWMRYWWFGERRPEYRWITVL